MVKNIALKQWEAVANAIFDVEEWKEELPVALKRRVSTEFKENCRTDSSWVVIQNSYLLSDAGFARSRNILPSLECYLSESEAFDLMYHRFHNEQGG